MTTSVEKMAEAAGKTAAFNGLTEKHNPFDGEKDNHLWDCWDGGFAKEAKSLKPFKCGSVSNLEHTHAYLDLSKEETRLRIVKEGLPK